MRIFVIHIILLISLLASSCSETKIMELHVYLASSIRNNEDDFNVIKGEKAQKLIKLLDDIYISSPPYIGPEIKPKRNKNRQINTSAPVVYVCTIYEMTIIEIYNESEIVYEICSDPYDKMILYKEGNVSSPHEIPSDFVNKLIKSIYEK